MRYSKIVIGIFLIVAVGVFVAFKSTAENSPPALSVTPTAPIQKSLETKVSEETEGGVTIEVTLQNSSSKDRWIFDVAMNTHSVELNEDLVSESVLIADGKDEYKPVSWEGAPSGGHHRSGMLTFAPITPSPKSIELKIRNIGGIPERSFVWNL